MNDKVEIFLKTNHISYEKGVSLTTKTWLRRGGVVGLYITPCSKNELQTVVHYLNEHSLSYEIVGHTSNIYYLDTYNPDIVISTAHVRKFEETEEHIVCDCGTSMSQLARYCIERGYRGYAGLINLPGTVGAAICNNSSCFNCSIEELIVSVEFLDTQCNEVRTLNPADFGFSFRNSKLKSGQLRGVILSAKLKKEAGVALEEIAKASQATAIRRKTQEPPAYTLGSCYAGLKPKAGTHLMLVKMGGGNSPKNELVHTIEDDQAATANLGCLWASPLHINKEYQHIQVAPQLQGHSSCF